MLSIYLNICAGLALVLLSALFWLGIWPVIVAALTARGLVGYTYWRADWLDDPPVHKLADGKHRFMCNGWKIGNDRQATKHEYNARPCGRCADAESTTAGVSDRGCDLLIWDDHVNIKPPTGDTS